MNIIIRHLERDECKEALNLLCKIHGNDFHELAQNYIESMFSSSFRKPFFVVALANQKIIAAAAYTEELFTTDVWGIGWVCVDEEYRHKKIGENIVKECLKYISIKAQKTVTVLLRTHPGQTGLYDSLGFYKLGDDHEGGNFMKLTLTHC